MPKQIEGEPYVRISVDEAADLHGNEDVVFVDVRRTDEYIEGHVEGALFITVDDVLGRIDELPRDKDLLFICAAGVRSGLACEMAAAMGYDSSKLYNIEEGTPTWIERGYPYCYPQQKMGYGLNRNPEGQPRIQNKTQLPYRSEQDDLKVFVLNQ